MLTFGSLFSGIGGIDLGFERAGMRCQWQVEIDKYASQVLAKHWPDVPRWDDIRTFPPAEGDWNVDLICGGFPCQDISSAGKGEGIHGARSGLFFELLRVVRRLHPRYVFLENVAALRFRGLDTVLGEMAALGFDAEWHCVPASAVGAPHQRDRIWIFAWRDVADAPCISGGARLREDVAGQQEAGSRLVAANDGGDASRPGDVADAAQRGQPELRRASGQAGFPDGSSQVMADASSLRQSPKGDQVSRRKASRSRQTDQPGDGGQVPGGRSEPQGLIGSAESDMGGTAHGISTWLDGLVGGLNAWGPDWERDVPRVTPKMPKRTDRLRCLGNAVVPQVAELFGRAIVRFHQGG